MAEKITLHAVAPVDLTGKRCDQVAHLLFPDYSRSRLQAWIKSGELTVDGKQFRAKDKVYADMVLDISATVADEEEWSGEDIPLDIVHEDDSVIVINKPVGLVVHPAAGHANGTLLNALLNHYPDLASVPRAGIVHRLDKDTSGLMVVAKTLSAHTDLVNQLQERSVSRTYQAVACGAMTGGGTVETMMDRHPRDRKKMAVALVGGKEAITHYRLMERFNDFTHIKVNLETGRTHQIRVHMAHIRKPLVGDQVYRGRLQLPKGATPGLIEVLRNFKRQALHAYQLELWHPETGDRVLWEAQPPADFLSLIAALRLDKKEREQL
ncbi:23S rRNA pseudouridine1911/1915/1917 synthase [Sinobacterium caligoides]|uniref:Pseudouridine synthase n=1 Tax=Sinobacterium caligoides TaxID=933926 RepID=A0A3N2E122_9GAMM|nr:23S rRNA pseudouridine(1911/1915/1917) synthase RluD [Sinobacterium caligoides]ROS05794.1 23S rRNA pseudouridine1911/1915/1917 synthase [Sinobacterium caligoides]